MRRVLILGATGMLGNMVESVFVSRGVHETVSTVRTPTALAAGVRHILFDAAEGKDVLDTLLRDVHPTFIINCIGIIKPHCRDDDAAGVRRAITVNALFPHQLAEAAQRVDARVIQIATDCVFSGKAGGYDERAPHDPLDAYGKTKSLGEVHAPNVLHLRTSIIGPERSRNTSLLEWFRNQPEGATISGYTDHWWNGVTTLQFADLCHRIVDQGTERGDALVTTSPVHHVVLNETVTKDTLLRMFARTFAKDVRVEAVESGVPVNRTLATVLHHLPIPQTPGPTEEALQSLRVYMENTGRDIRVMTPTIASAHTI